MERAISCVVVCQLSALMRAQLLLVRAVDHLARICEEQATLGHAWQTSQLFGSVYVVLIMLMVPTVDTKAYLFDT